ncbi:MAG: phospholipid carrier-dependent glycosyltransferase, partial [Gemmatimonadaceae bacterium]
MVIPDVSGDRPDMVQQPRPAAHHRHVARWIALAIAVIAAFAVVRAAGHFNQTFDEGAHVASGIEWFQFHTYGYDPQHPPLGRIAIALGPWLSGVRGSHLHTSWEEGNRILMDGNRYAHTLALARLGVLPFFLLLLATVWVWTRWRYGETAALLAVLLTATVSPVLAQAGLATTDMPLAGTLCFAWYAMLRWLERPGFRRTALLALAFALAVTSKFSALPYFCLAALFVVVWRLVFGDRVCAGGNDAERVTRWRIANLGAFVVPAVLGLIGAGFVIWGVYRFHVSWARGGHIPIPAPELRAGLQQLVQHNTGGQAAYIFG